MWRAEGSLTGVLRYRGGIFADTDSGGKVQGANPNCRSRRSIGHAATVVCIMSDSGSCTPKLIDDDEAAAENFEHLYRMVDGVGLFSQVHKLRDEKRAAACFVVHHSFAMILVRSRDRTHFRRKTRTYG